LGEVLPRALLNELGLPSILLGSSGGGQFLVVLSGELQAAAEAFLNAAAAQVSELSSGVVELVWASTGNLGGWAVIRRRLHDRLEHCRNAPLQGVATSAFQPYVATSTNAADQYFGKELGAKLREAASIGWSPENPGKVLVGEGKHTWPVTSNLSSNGILLARHVAVSDDGKQAAPVPTLARRAQGRAGWGGVRGGVPNLRLPVRPVAS